MSLAKVGVRLGELMKKEVTFLDDCVGEATEKACADPAAGNGNFDIVFGTCSPTHVLGSAPPNTCCVTLLNLASAHGCAWVLDGEGSL